MAWTTPANWADDELVTHTKMNTHVRDNLSYLKDVLDGAQTQDWTPRRAAADAVGVSVVYGKARGASLGSPAVVSASDALGTLGWAGYDGSAYREAVQLKAYVDGTPGASDMPGALSILTSADGGITLTERLRVDAAGKVWVNHDNSTTQGIASLAANLTDTGIGWDWNSGNSTKTLTLWVNGEATVQVSQTGAGDSYTLLQNDVSVFGQLEVFGDLAVSVSGGNQGVDSTGWLYTNNGGLNLGGVGTSDGGTAVIAISDQGGPAGNPDSGSAYVWYDDAAGALKLRTDTGLIRQMLHAGARVHHNAAQSIPNATATALAFNSERFDSDGFHSTSSNTSRLTVPAGMGGRYTIQGHVRFATNNTGFREISIRLNGATILAIEDRPAITGTPTIFGISTTYDLAAGDYVELTAYQSSGGALDVEVAGNYSPEFSLTSVG